MRRLADRDAFAIESRYDFDAQSGNDAYCGVCSYRMLYVLKVVGRLKARCCRVCFESNGQGLTQIT